MRDVGKKNRQTRRQEILSHKTNLERTSDRKCSGRGKEETLRVKPTFNLLPLSVPTCCCPSFYHQTQKGFRKQTQKGNVTNMWGDTDFHLKLRRRAQSD